MTLLPSQSDHHVISHYKLNQHPVKQTGDEKMGNYQLSSSALPYHVTKFSKLLQTICMVFSKENPLLDLRTKKVKKYNICLIDRLPSLSLSLSRFACLVLHQRCFVTSWHGWQLWEQIIFNSTSLQLTNEPTLLAWFYKHTWEHCRTIYSATELLFCLWKVCTVYTSCP